MNIEEGARRMKTAGQWMFVGPSTIAILFWVIGMIAGHLFRGFGILILAQLWLVGLALYLAIAGAALWLLSWIVEGFAKSQS
jgi:hypothetical protein